MFTFTGEKRLDLLQQYVQENGQPLELMIEYVVPEYLAYFLKILIFKGVMVPLRSK